MKTLRGLRACIAIEVILEIYRCFQVAWSAKANDRSIGDVQILSKGHEKTSCGIDTIELVAPLLS